MAKLLCKDSFSIAFGGCPAAWCVVTPTIPDYQFISLQILSSSHLHFLLYLKLSQVAHIFKKDLSLKAFLLLMQTHIE